jgi:hypothetical protein
MKLAMDNGNTGHVYMVVSWLFGFVGAVSWNIIPIILSSAASIMAIVNYYYQIKKNKKP